MSLGTLPPGGEDVLPALPTFRKIRAALDNGDAALVRPYWAAAVKKMADISKWKPVTGTQKQAVTMDIDFAVPGLDGHQRIQWLERLSGGFCNGYSFTVASGTNTSPPGRFTVTLVDPPKDDGDK